MRGIVERQQSCLHALVDFSDFRGVVISDKCWVGEPPSHGRYINMIFMPVAVPIELTAFDIVRRVQINQSFLWQLLADLIEKLNRIQSVNLNMFAFGGNCLYPGNQIGAVVSSVKFVFAVLCLAANHAAFKDSRPAGAIEKECGESNFRLGVYTHVRQHILGERAGFHRGCACLDLIDERVRLLNNRVPESVNGRVGVIDHDAPNMLAQQEIHGHASATRIGLGVAAAI